MPKSRHPTFTLARDYAPRNMALALLPLAYPRRGWAFYGTDGATTVPARDADGAAWPEFKSRKAALAWALDEGVPAWVQWCGRRKCSFEPFGTSFQATAHPRA